MKELQDKAEEWFNEVCEHKTEKGEHLSIDSFKILLSISFKEMQGEVIDPRFEEIPMYQLIKFRAEYIKLKLTPFAILFLSYICDRPGTAVMYLYFIKIWCIKHNVELVSVENIANIFPKGFLGADSLEYLWSKQKVEGANLLDILSY